MYPDVAPTEEPEGFQTLAIDATTSTVGAATTDVQSLIHDSSTSVLCPGYCPDFPGGDSPITTYPFLLHISLTLPWTTIIQGNTLILRSTSCSNIGSNIKNRPGPCTFCRNLENHNVVMGFRHRALDGAPETTPFRFLGPGQMYTAFERHKSAGNRLKLAMLNSRRAIGIRNRHLESWKRLAIAIGQENIPRIQTIIANACRKGSSILGLLDKVKQAGHRHFRSRTFDEHHFQLSFLIHKLGGRTAATIVQNVFGMPSINATKRHIATVALTPSPSVPTKTEVEMNLQIIYPRKLAPLVPPDSGAVRIFGVSMGIDEIKIQERLRWDPHTNMILGVCREHGHHCALEFRSLVQADVLRECLKKNIVHLATEVSS